MKQKSGNRDNPLVKSTRKFSEELAQPRRACGSCGLMHPRKQCPSFIKRCLRCKKPNHFAKYCRSVPHRTDAIEQTKQAGDSESDELLFIDAIKSSTEITDCDCFTMLNVEETSIRFKVDTGSQVNILPSSLYHTLITQSPLKQCNAQLTSYSGGNLKVMGCTHLYCQQKRLLFYVVDTMQDPILGLSASQKLGIVKIILNITHDSDRFVKLHPKLFKGLGCLKMPYHIKIDPSVNPVVTPC